MVLFCVFFTKCLLWFQFPTTFQRFLKEHHFNSPSLNNGITFYSFCIVNKFPRTYCLRKNIAFSSNRQSANRRTNLIRERAFRRRALFRVNLSSKVRSSDSVCWPALEEGQAAADKSNFHHRPKVIHTLIWTPWLVVSGVVLWYSQAQRCAKLDHYGNASVLQNT